MINISGDGAISIMDIVELCSNFSRDSPLGSEVHHMLQTYTDRNLRVRFNPNKLSFTKETYLSTFHKPCLVKELDQLLCQQFL